MQTPSWQDSSLEQGSPSSQLAPSGIATPMHCPLRQTSASVQASISSQSVPFSTSSFLQPSGDKQVSLIAMQTLASQHGGIWISQGVLPSNSKAAVRSDANYLGSYSGAVAQSPSDAGAGEMNAGDLDNARNFGRRVAGIAARFTP